MYLMINIEDCSQCFTSEVHVYSQTHAHVDVPGVNVLRQELPHHRVLQ